MWGNCWSPLGTIRLPRWLGGRESACSVGDVGSIPGSGRCPGEGDGNPLQCPCLENPTDIGDWPATVHGVANSLTQFSGWACIGFTSLSGFTWGENRERLSACVERSPQEQGGCSEHEHQPWTGRLAAAAGAQAWERWVPQGAEHSPRESSYSGLLMRDVLTYSADTTTAVQC